MSEHETIVRSTAARSPQSQHRVPSTNQSASPDGGPNRGRSWAGKTLGEYEIGDLIGKGGNGEVYRGTHRWLDRSVAIKFLVGLRADDEESAERFRREAQVAAAMIHPNIIRATDGGVVGGQLFLVTDFVDGLDLSELVRDRGRLGIADVCAIGVQAATALGFVASRKTVHRDVKPSNLMLDREGTVKLLDLGLARATDHGQTMTATGQVMGTIDFMAPEQATDPRRVDQRADIYSLGCTLYYLLVGKAPFSTDHLDTLAAKLLATVESDPMPITKLRRDVPSKLVRLIETMLDKDPQRRPRDFDVVSQSLQAFAGGADLAAIAKDDSSTDTVPRDHAASISMRVENVVATSSRTTAKLILRGLGFLEPVPTVRAGQRQTYRFSFQWLKRLTFIAGFAGFLWFTGFRIESNSQRPQLDRVLKSNQGTKPLTSGLQYNDHIQP